MPAPAPAPAPARLNDGAIQGPCQAGAIMLTADVASTETKPPCLDMLGSSFSRDRPYNSERAVKTSAAVGYDDDPVNRRGGVMQVSSSDIQSLGPSKICLIGRTGRDVEMRGTQTGKQVANVSLAVKRKDAQGEDVTEWFKLNAWEELAASLASVKKGTMIAVSGSPSIN
eukprot:gene30900-35953_t